MREEASRLATRIGEVAAAIGRRVQLMEVCGTHTVSIFRHGIRALLPDNVRLISGPGCPVCVTAQRHIDAGIELAGLEDVIFATYGDMVRVPGRLGSLQIRRARGADVRVISSAMTAVDLARDNPDKQIVFSAVGFETTVPTIAGALAEAEADGVPNFLLLPGNKTMPEVMKVLVDDPDLDVDGFLLPGHVSVITGWKLFEFLADDFGVSGVVAGFMPTDVAQGVLALVRQAADGSPGIGNVYGRVVTADGNRHAREIVDRYFEPSDEIWRGFGTVPGSGLTLRSELLHRDATQITVDLPDPFEPEGCRCGDVLRGVIDPPECPLFDAGCDPDTPVGACMVSSEGTCAAWYRHERWESEVCS